LMPRDGVDGVSLGQASIKGLWRCHSNEEIGVAAC
jgi:hypothetical protein